jgi:hypothetical protein
VKSWNKNICTSLPSRPSSALRHTLNKGRIHARTRRCANVDDLTAARGYNKHGWFSAEIHGKRTVKQHVIRIPSAQPHEVRDSHQAHQSPTVVCLTELLRSFARIAPLRPCSSNHQHFSPILFDGWLTLLLGTLRTTSLQAT